MTREARKRISESQKERWAKIRANGQTENAKATLISVEYLDTNGKLCKAFVRRASDAPVPAELIKKAMAARA